MHEIVFLDASTIGPIPELELLQSFGKVFLYEHSSYEETFERVKTCSIVLTNKVILDNKILAAAKNLKLICITATGMNNVDIHYAAERNITVKNVKGYSTNSVAQITFGSLLYLINQIPFYDEFVKSGKYAESLTFTNISRPFWQIEGKVFGIIGLGTIGQKVAEIAQAFGARVIYYSTSGQNSNTRFSKVSLHELLQSSDIISIHAPLNDATKNLLNYERLKLMKPSAVLINTGRGGIVNERDLALALNENIIYAAAVDVLEQEPITPANPLLQVFPKDKLLITPHIAWASIESRKELMRLTVENIRQFMNNTVEYE